MKELLTTELKRDMESIYKKAGDMLNIIETKDFGKESIEVQELLDMIKFRLEDICGTLQKDIFHCDYLVTKCNIGTAEGFYPIND